MENYTIPLPLLRPVRIPTRGLPWYKKFFKYFEARKWEVMEDYMLYLPWLDTWLLIPKGFIFNGASVPRLFWPIVDPVGILLIGSMFHDFGYIYSCFIDKDFRRVYYNAGQATVDEQIRKISMFINDMSFITNSAWCMLRLFGWIAWRKWRKINKNVLVDFAQTHKEMIGTVKSTV